MRGIVIALIFVLLLVISFFLYSSKSPPIVGSTDKATYFAEVDKNGNVLRVIVADQAFIDSGVVGDSSTWIQTDMDGAIRKNGASKGFTYDKSLDAFISPKPQADATLDTKTAQWTIPIKASTTLPVI